MRYIKIIVVAVVLAVLAACGSGSGEHNVGAAVPVAYEYTITVSGSKLVPMDVPGEVALMQKDGLTVLSVEGSTIRVSGNDTAINAYIAEGMWVRISGKDVNIKRMID